jgi:very-short-patch-repair endonuclease
MDAGKNEFKYALDAIPEIDYMDLVGQHHLMMTFEDASFGIRHLMGQGILIEEIIGMLLSRIPACDIVRSIRVAENRDDTILGGPPDDVLGDWEDVSEMPWGPFGRQAPYVEPRQAPVPSPIEGQFWSAYLRLNPRELRGLTPQYKVGPYRVDFAMPRQKFAIELDGFRSHSSTADIARDRARERYLQYHGWFIIRFGGAEVYDHAEACVKESAVLFNVWKRHR